MCAEGGQHEHGKDEATFSRPRAQPERIEVSSGSRRQLRRTEPGGAGEHSLRALGVETAVRVAEGPGVPGLPGKAGGRGSVAPARETGRASAGDPDRSAPDAAGRAGRRGGGNGRGAGGDRTGAGADRGPAAAVSGASGKVPLPGSRRAFWRPPEISGLRVGAGAEASGVPSVFQRGLEDWGARSVDRVGWRHAGAPSGARGEQQSVLGAALGPRAKFGQPGAVGSGPADGRGLGAALPSRTVLGGDPGRSDTLSGQLLSCRELDRVG
jgi:hypothetical protein